jgi:hypothetical protein
MASETYVFILFALKGTIFARFQNPFLHSKRIFGFQFLWNFFSGNQNGGLVQDGSGKKAIDDLLKVIYVEFLTKFSFL